MPRVSPNTTQQCEFAESLLTLSEPGPDGVVGPRPGPRSMLRRSAPARNTMGDTFRLPRTRSAWAFAPTLADRFWLAIGVWRIEARPARASSSPQEASGGRGRQPHYAACGTPLPGQAPVCLAPSMAEIQFSARRRAKKGRGGPFGWSAPAPSVVVLSYAVSSRSLKRPTPPQV
jgi:hypothetical protein